MNRQPYIAIEGPIGVGKTTLARVLGEALPAEILLEVFEQNPFLGDFYADRARYAFQTQIFFLLSRYHQQHRVIASTIQRSPLVSDYLFAKDWLFAHLNIAGDELAMYERVHAILGEQIPAPDLVVYLRASTDTLMERIAFRDRPYERQMERDYIHALRQVYEQFFADYTVAPLLVLDTEQLDVRNPQARATVVGQVRHALQSTSFQPRLLESDIARVVTPQAPRPGSRLVDWQRFRHQDGGQTGAQQGLYFNYISLVARLGEIGRAMAGVWQEEDRQMAQTGNRAEAREHALTAAAGDLENGLADALDYVLRVANDAGIDLENAYLKHMGQVS